MRKRIVLAGLISFVFHDIFAQGGGYETDALKYSQSTISGSSRTQGLAGTGVATGADISSANINPAGLGLLRKNELSGSLSIGMATTNTNFLGSGKSDGRLYAGIPNIGIAFNKLKDDNESGAYRGGTFAISFTKINNFQNQLSYSGLNNSNSIGDFFVEQANGTKESSFVNDFNSQNNSVSSLASAAYNSGIIDPIYTINQNTHDTIPVPGTSSNYQTRFPADQVRQSETILTKAGMYSWDFSYGGNVKNKFFFGFGLGVVRLNYSYERNFHENITSPNYFNLTDLSIYDTYSAKGYGVNLKAGLIYKPNDIVRFGLSGQTPTYYSINETYSTDFNSILNNQTFPLSLPLGSGQYNLLIPGKISPGIAFFFGKHGFITSEISYINYTGAKYSNSPSQSGYANANDVIKSTYTNTVNVKFAGEFRKDIFRLRAGLAYYGDPYKNGQGLNRSSRALTVGAGIRLKDYYIDGALVHYTTSKSVYQPYTLQNGGQPIATTNSSLNTLNLTLGAYF